jgi:hypothetical protein
LKICVNEGNTSKLDWNEVFYFTLIDLKPELYIYQLDPALKFVAGLGKSELLGSDPKQVLILLRTLDSEESASLCGVSGRQRYFKD